MYYVLRCFGPLDRPIADLGACPEVDGVEFWTSGEAVTVPVPQPLEFEIDPDAPGELIEMYQVEMLLMTRRLVQALRGAGVDNLQVYDAVIRDPTTGQEFHTHQVVNVVGAIACADLDQSQFLTPRGEAMIDVDFDSLAVDPARAGGQLLFRLAECVSAVVVHEKVRDHVLAQGIDTLTFQPPAEFIG